MERETGAKTSKKIVTLSILTLLSALGISGLDQIKKENIDISKIIQHLVDGTSYGEIIETQNSDSNKDVDNVKTHQYIYLPGNSSAPEPVEFVEEIVNDNQVYIFNDNEYELVRIVTFYTDEKNNKIIANNFAGHLKLGEIIKFLDKENGVNRFSIYKRHVKEQDSPFTQYNR